MEQELDQLSPISDWAHSRLVHWCMRFKVIFVPGTGNDAHKIDFLAASQKPATAQENQFGEEEQERPLIEVL